MNKVAMVVCAAVSLALSCICLVGTANAAPAVTPRQMTNYVGAVVSESEARTSNMVDTVAADERAYMKGYVDDAIDKSGGITPTVTNLVYHAVSNVVEYSVVTGIVHVAATNIVSQSLSNIYQRVDSVEYSIGVAQSNINVAVGVVTNYGQRIDTSFSNIVNFVMQGNEKPQVYKNGDGTYSTRRIIMVNGTPKIYYTTNTWESTSEYATHLGARVMTSTVDDLPQFSLFAYVNVGEPLSTIFGSTQFLYNAGLDSEFKFILHDIYTDPTNEQFKTPFFETVYDDTGSIVETPKYFVKCLDSDVLGTQTIYVYTNDTSTISNVFGQFTIEPYRLSDSEFSTLCGQYGEGDTGVDEWIDQSGIRLDSFKVKNILVSVNGRPVNEEEPQLLSASRRRIVLKASSANNVPLSKEPMSAKVNWNSVYKSELDEDEEWTPSEYWSRDDYSNAANWIPFPFHWELEEDFGDGIIIKTDIMIESFSDFDLYNIPMPKIPPTPPNWPTKKNTNYCKQGMHCYVNCVCIKCGDEREHSWGGASASGCAQCQNKNMEYNEREVPVETDSFCIYGRDSTHPCTSSDESNHGGWQYVGEPDEERICQCKCKHLNLNHSWGEPYGDWEDIDDNWHGKLQECTRNCGAQKYNKERHVIELVEPVEQTSPISSYEHYANGKCTKCPHEGNVVEGHRFVSEGEGAEKCFCETCQEYFHVFEIEKNCGSSHLRQCSRCDVWQYLDVTDGQWKPVPYGQEDQYHTFGIKLYEDDSEYDKKHRCFCGTLREHHSFNSDHTACMVCDWVADTEERHGCRFNKRSGGRGSSSDNDHYNVNNSSFTGINGTCPDPNCNGSIHNDVSIDESKLSEAFITFSWTDSLTKISPTNPSNLINTVSAVESAFLDNRTEGNSMTTQIWLNQGFETRHNDFTDTDYKVPVWGAEITYSGTIRKDKKGTTYIKWSK